MPWAEANRLVALVDASIHGESHHGAGTYRRLTELRFRWITRGAGERVRDRLRRAEGQVRAVQWTLDDNRPCEDVVTQLLAGAMPWTRSFARCFRSASASVWTRSRQKKPALP